MEKPDIKYVANSAISYAGKKYLPGQLLPDAPPETVARWLTVGYAVPMKGKPPEGEKSSTAGPPVPDKSMSTEELKALALLYGVDASKKKTKDEIIAMIMATGMVPA